MLDDREQDPRSGELKRLLSLCFESLSLFMLGLVLSQGGQWIPALKGWELQILSATIFVVVVRWVVYLFDLLRRKPKT